MQDELRLQLRSAHVQLMPVVLPQRFLVDTQNAGDLSLRDPLGGQHMDETALHVRRVMPGSSMGFCVLHSGREKVPWVMFCRRQKKFYA